MQRRHAALLMFLALTVVLMSCNGVHQLAGTLQDLQKVQIDLAKTLDYDQIRVNLQNGDVLQVAIVNSPWKEPPVDQKNTKALEIARLAYNRYRSRSALRSVIISFAVHRSYVGVFNYDDSRDSLGFEIPQLTAEPQTPK